MHRLAPWLPRVPFAVALALGGAACGESDEPAGVGPSDLWGESEGPGEAAPEPALRPRRCVAPAGMGAPQTIAAALDLLNALPPPVTVACVVESLDRPLEIHAATSIFSAQPAGGARSPRIFIFSGELILSIVPAGSGRELLEFGESYGDGESLKGELRMPLDPPVLADAPFDHLRFDEIFTTCGVCHRDERLAPEIGHPNAYVSRALRPVVESAVPIDDLRGAHAACDAEEEPERCAILEAIFAHGPVVHRDFPAELATIFDP